MAFVSGWTGVAVAPQKAQMCARPGAVVMSAMNPDKKLPDRFEPKQEPGKKVAYCRCWQSESGLCNGSHKKWNEENGDNLGPVVVTVPKPE